MSDSSIEVISRRWKTVYVELRELDNGKIQLYLIGDGVPYAFWVHAYQNLEMSRTHANRLKERLEEGKHYISVSKEEMKQYYPSVHAAWTAKYKLGNYVFLSDEGYNRTIIEVNTSGMKDKEIAARIDRRKDEIAEVFTKYKRGELTPVDSPPIIERITEKRLTSTDLSKQVARAVNEKIVPLYRRRGENPRTAFSRENRAINEITAGEHEADLKNKLNSAGLDVQIAAKISDLTLLEANVVVDEVRWTNVKRVVDGLYPCRLEQPIKLNERELTLIKRGCTKDQKSLFEFRPNKQISGGSS